MFNVDRIIVNWMIKICSDFQSLSHAVFYGSTENEDQLCGKNFCLFFTQQVRLGEAFPPKNGEKLGKIPKGGGWVENP